MSCICRGSYICDECDKKIKWRNLTTEEKNLLLTYSDLLSNDIENSDIAKLALKVFNKGLCTSLIPQNEI